MQVQARAAKRIDEQQKTNHQMEKNDELYRTIARKDRQLDAERMPDKDLVTDAEVWAYGERRDHYRIAFHYAGVLFNLSSSTGGGGDNSSLRWDGKNDDEEADAQRRVLFHRAYILAKGGTGGYGRKK